MSPLRNSNEGYIGCLCISDKHVKESIVISKIKSLGNKNVGCYIVG
jgi:hypothetical protein